MIDIAEVRSMIAAALPLRVRWMIGETPIDYDFSLARDELRPLEKVLLEQGDQS